MDKRLLNDEFFEWHKRHADLYARVTGARLFKLLKPKSVADFGCGIGSYLVAAVECGIQTIRGFDIGGEVAKKYADPCVHDLVDWHCDLSKPYDPEKYECVLCVETAEHIDPDGARNLVETLAKATSGLLVWTAAPEDQDGCGHVNCQPKEYWLAMFDAVGMMPAPRDVYNMVRAALGGSPQYIMDNLLVIVHKPRETERMP